MDQNQNQRTNLRAPQFNPSRNAIIDLFNNYLGKSSRQKSDDAIRETPNKLQKRVTALNRDLPPPNEQFLFDFEQLQSQSPDQEQLRTVTESVLIALVVQCCNHAPRSEFILFALRSLCNIGYVNWDSFLPSLLSSVSSAEMSAGQGSQATNTTSSNSVSQAGPMPLPCSNVLPNSSSFQPSTSTSPLPSIHGIGSPAQSAPESSTAMNPSPLKPSTLFLRDNVISCLRQMCCKIILIALESNLKPVTHSDIFSHLLNWLVNWDQRKYFGDCDVSKAWKSDRTINEWLHSCLDVIWLLVEEVKCRVPFYELIRSGLQFIDNIPDDEALFTLILEIHRRRDMVAMHMQMLDQHLHCPSFGTHRFISQVYPSASGEQLANTRYSPITYPSVLGEPLHGEDLATSIQRGSLDWERAMRCLRHALRSNPSPDWWRRVVIVATCYKLPAQQLPTPGAVFSSGMICEAAIDRTMELLRSTNSEIHCWQEWLMFSDILYFLFKLGGMDFLDFVDKLASRVIKGDQHILRSNHVTWLLAQIIRIEIVTNALNTDPKKVETTRKILSFHKEEKSSDPNNVNPQSILLDFISSSQTLRIWSINASIREYLNHEQLQKGRQIDEWWKQFTKGDRIMDYMNLDDRSVGMFWVLSYTMAQPACEAVMNWLTSAGVTELLPGSSVQSNERAMMMRECCPLPMSLLSGLSINLCTKLAHQIEETLFINPVIPSIAMVETYVRLLLIHPHSLFRSHFTVLTQRSPSILSKSGVSVLLLEILNYRLIPLYRYHGKSKALMQDVTKLVSMLKGKRGDHRVFRLAENLSINLIFSFRDFFVIKKEKGPSEVTETLNRVAVMSLAITIKTRGLAEVEHIRHLQSLLEQILSTCQHTWSEKTLRYFPPRIREILMAQMDKRSHAIQAWQLAETTVINQCTQLLSPSADPSYVMTYINHSFPQHRQYLCAGAWMLMHGHPENINSINLARVLREFSPEEVTSNIYTMVDVVLHHIHTELQHGHLLQDLLLKAITNLAFFIWTHELLPFDILLLALIDRDDDPHALRIMLNLIERTELQQRIKLFCVNRGSHEHWLYSGNFKRTDLQKALGNHLSWKDRYPPFFDDIAARLLPIIPLIIYRLIENDITDTAEKILVVFKAFFVYYPLRFTFVRDILAYFYGHLPGKLIVRILSVLDISKIPFSESFPKLVSSSNPVMCPPQDYFASLLLNLVNNVIPPLNSKSKSGPATDSPNNSLHGVHSKASAAPQSGTTNVLESQKAFYQNQDPGTSTQLVLETAVIELLSLPVSPTQIVSSLVQVIVHVQPTLIQSNNGLQGTSSSVGQGSVLPTSPSGGSTDSLGTNRSTPSTSGINASNFVSRSGYTSQQLSCLLIQACGLLLAQLPPEFHSQLYLEASRIIKDCWWLTDGQISPKEVDSAVGFTLLDPTWAAQDNTSTAIGNIVALLHSFFSNLPQEWLEGTDAIIKHLKPVTSVAMLRITFRIMGPLLPRLVMATPLFGKTLVLLFNGIADVFGKNSQQSTPTEASAVADLIDFLHHAILYEGQGGPVQTSSKPKYESLATCGALMEMLRPDIQHLLSHLRIDPNTSIYAATDPKVVQNPS